MEIRITEQLHIHANAVMLPQVGPTALSGTGEVAKNRQSKLLQRRTRLDDPFEAWNDPSLSSFFLTGLVQPTQIEASLENMV